ncbi:MAG: hypothetical protein EOS17_14240 [Mesorhizobium sp.]|nr:MAG: hypothetical protein EOS17_14240 [Mesorhizobium sp.]
MRIKNAGRGIHEREIKGIEKFKALPVDWYGFTNLELALAAGQSREIDFVAVIEDRILLIDLKDWDGKIESDQGRWYQNNRDRGQSPVEKIRANARKLAEILKRHIQDIAKKQGKPGKVGTPYIQGCVVLTGTATAEGIALNEQSSVFSVDEFVRKIADSGPRNALLGEAPWIDRTNSLVQPAGYWRQTLGGFFNVQTGPFRPLHRIYGNYRALSDKATYRHRDGIYTEFDAEDNAPGRAPGLLRVWDFTKADTRFQTEEGRSEIAGRERDVVAYLKDRNLEFESSLLQPKDADHERSVNFWEVFERRRQLQRLADIGTVDPLSLSDQVRLDLARALLAKAKAMHDLDASHLDIGGHSVWLELPSTIRLSHLLATSYPEINSLGEHRYQFLTSGVKLPEDAFGDQTSHKKRDVFLLAAAVHHILFGTAPQAIEIDAPPEWRPSVDFEDHFAALHPWFAKALEWDAAKRFVDAGEMLAAFNATVSTHPRSTALSELDRFRHWPDQMELVETFPRHETLKKSDRVIVWKSVSDGSPVIVKLWRRSCWGDDRQESQRILSFLEKAEALRTTPVAGVAKVLHVGFLGDAIVVVHEYVDGLDLQRHRTENLDDWIKPTVALGFAERLATLVRQLHDSGVAHGDLKPSNIMVTLSEAGAFEPVLIDLLDFGPSADGEILTQAYAPSGGGSRFERDRYATTKIAEDIFSTTNLIQDAVVRLGEAVARCRSGPPPNATLLPLIEAIDVELAPVDEDKVRPFKLRLVRGETGPVLSDEGTYGVRLNRERTSVFIRGASEEVELKLFDRRFVSGRRRAVEQGHIARVQKFELVTFAGELEIEASEINEFSDLEFLLEDPALNYAPAQNPEPTKVPDNELATQSLDDDQAYDEVVEAASLPARVASAVDVPLLWRTLVDVEQELFTEGLALGDSSYRPSQKRHLVPLELDRGAFDFARHDRVVVERPRKKGDGWTEIGLLDVEGSLPSAVLIEPTSRGFVPSNGPLVREGDRLRFRSMMETYSRSRRETATNRILSRQSVLPGLIDVFDLSSTAGPKILSTAPDHDALMKRYGLNDVQARAFADLVRVRPLGLLQGPPGTGKTEFIASFVHFALTENLVRNVLLASQSHEAVNNAAEAVLRLFRAEGSDPSLVRVGQEGSVSNDLRPFHSDRVERRFKDRFNAELRERLLTVGKRIGLDSDIIEHLSFAETAILPVVERLRHLAGEPEASGSRISSLTETIIRLSRKVGVEYTPTTDWDDPGSYDKIVDAITQARNANASKVERFLSATKLARDWMGSTSTHQRSFETFLAGTRNIVAGTCVGLGRAALGLTQTQFDLVVIDEAARCTASELSVPMQSGRWILLVGDQLQLEPHHRPDVVEAVTRQIRIPRRELLRSDFERVFAMPYGKAAGRTLTTQYRMLPPIGDIVSKSFYGNRLKHGRVKPVLPKDALPAKFDQPLAWISTDSLGTQAFQTQSPAGRSLVNEAEADTVVALLRDLDGHKPFRDWLSLQKEFQHPIGIICTYAAQRDLIRRRLPAAGLATAVREACKIDTVDSYQGKQNPIIILSLVRNNREGQTENGAATIKPGFMERPNRINVAISRAMDRLFLVGAIHGWGIGSPMAAVIAAFKAEVGDSNASVIDAATMSSSVTDAPAKRVARTKNRGRHDAN